jgi:ASPIC and UnbV/Calx-beta domain/FG-GAP-like repeat
MKISLLLATLAFMATSCLAQFGFLFEPLSQSASLGADALFLGTAYSPEPPTYQWRKNGAPLIGQNQDYLYLANLQLPDAGDYDVIATTSFGSITSQVATLTVEATFTKLLTDPLVTEIGNSTGSAWGDFDNDGDLDVLVTHNGNDFNSLFRNNGNGTFAKLVLAPITTDIGPSLGATWVDYDNDGWLDLLVINNGTTNFLYHNNGGGTFSRVNAGIGNDSAGIFTVAWADYDRDGWVDLATGPVGGFGPGGGGRSGLYHNENGVLNLVSNGIPGGFNLLAVQSASWADYDRDGDPDLFFASVMAFGGFLNGNELLFRNEGDLLTQVTTGALVSSGNNSITAAWADYDNDGDLDVYVGNVDGELKFLFRNDGSNVFTQVFGEIAEEEGAVQSAAWGDYDNDGWIDLFLATAAGGGNLLVRNNGDGTFTHQDIGSPTGDRATSVGGVWVDIDNNGFLDLFVANFGENNFLYRNNGNSNRWLGIKCAPYLSNRSAIGAKVRVLATIGGTERWQLREIAARDSFGSPNTLRAEFGLGDATNITTLRVEWPSGLVTELHNVAPNQFLTVTEPPSISIVGGQVFEGDAGTRELLFTVRLQEPSTNIVSVDFTTANLTALAGTDYITTNGTLYFVPGQTSATVVVSVIGNLADQPNRLFSLILSNATFMQIGLARATGTILDDDPLTVSIGPGSVVEGDVGTTELAMPVFLSKVVNTQVSVRYETLTSGNAQPGIDFIATNGLLFFDPGQTNRSFPISVLGDRIDELNETIAARIFNSTNAVLDAVRSAFGTILNDDPIPAVSIGNTSVVEGNTGTNHAVFTATLSGQSSRTITVSFSTQDDSAASGSDYVAQTGTLSFSSLATNRTLAIVINGDTMFELAETFFVNLTNPTNAVLGVSQGVGTILDDDLKITGASMNGSDFRFQFASVAGHRYRVEWTTALTAASMWVPLSGYANVLGTGNIIEVTDVAAGNEQQRFYRLVLLDP